ncbi:hypothetical protein [Xanthomonas bundabergensis]|uniref:hypothetical protein n=1 Tax=Xanthomonas bundabergensis TaxID=3160842 RepID=UPI0035190875
MPSRLPPGTYAIAITVVAVAIASVAAWRERPTDAASRRDLGEAIGDTANAVAARKPEVLATASGQPSAPADAPHGGEPRFDRHGQVLPDPDLRRYLDRYLAGQDAQPLATRRQRLQRDLAATMPAARAQQILVWFDRYAAYLQAEAGSAQTADPQRQAQRTQALRDRLLGAQAATALFADQPAAH